MRGRELLRSSNRESVRMHSCRVVLTLVALALLASVAAACGGSSDDSAETPVATPSAADVIPILVSHELTVGENRFVVGLQDRDNNLILDAEVHQIVREHD